jgi:hypothetical protein
MFLNQELREGRWANWLAKLQEYDLEIKPLKVFKGHGLCKFMTWIEAIIISPPNAFDVVVQGTSLANSEWYKDIIFYLKYGQFPPEMSSKERRTLKMKTNHYVLVSKVLFRRNFDCVL